MRKYSKLLFSIFYSPLRQHNLFFRSILYDFWAIAMFAQIIQLEIKSSLAIIVNGITSSPWFSRQK